MKILIIHQYFLAPGEPGGSRFNEFARLWRERGHDVTVICGSLNYTTSSVPAHLRGRWTWHGVEEGTDVWRCYVPASYNRGYLGRMWAFFGFTLSSLTAVLRTKRPDVIIATSPPLTTGPTGWLASCWHRVPWVFEMRDLWPESAITTGVISRGSLLARLLFAIERFSSARADRINVLTPAFQADIIERGLADASKISFVPNGADLDAFTPGSRENEVRRRHSWGSRFVALYAGAHGRANALMQLVDAANVLRDRPDILIVTVGDGPERLRCEARAKELGLSNIEFIGARPKAEMPDYVRACDAGLAVLQNNPTFRTVYPNKVFDYMATERPTVLAIDGVARTLVCSDADAGVFAEPENGAAIAAEITRLAGDPNLCQRLGQNGRAWVTANASRHALADKYLALLAGMNKP